MHGPRPEVHLSDLEWISASAGYGGDPRRDRSIEERPLAIDGEASAKGVGTDAKSERVVAIDPSYGRFVGGAGSDDEIGDRDVCSVVFQVLVDGELAAESVVIEVLAAWYFDVPLPAVAERFSLRVLEADSRINSVHADRGTPDCCCADRLPARAETVWPLAGARGSMQRTT